MITRSDRPFLGIWRGDREFTEWRRGERVLWQKEVPEEPKEKLKTLTLTAASYADLALLDTVLWVVGQGYAGHVVANIKGEYHSFSGDNLLATVRSEVTFNDGCTVTMALGEESDLPDGCLQEGDSITVELVVEQRGVEWVSKEVTGDTVLITFPCLIPNNNSVGLFGFPSGWDGVWRTIEVVFNGIYLGTVQSGSYLYNEPELSAALVGIQLGFSTEQINKVLSETTERPLRLELNKMPTESYKTDGTGFKLFWGAVEKTITLVVTKNADENML